MLGFGLAGGIEMGKALAGSPSKCLCLLLGPSHPTLPCPSGRQFLDGFVVVLRDGGRQGVPVVGVQLDDLQQQGARQHGLGGTQHLVAGYRQQLRHHLGQLLLQQPAGALQLSGEDGVNHDIVILTGLFQLDSIIL